VDEFVDWVKRIGRNWFQDQTPEMDVERIPTRAPPDSRRISRCGLSDVAEVIVEFGPGGASYKLCRGWVASQWKSVTLFQLTIDLLSAFLTQTSFRMDFGRGKGGIGQPW
jgi:hypothetical protein